jgi:hypothetical protein
MLLSGTKLTTPLNPGVEIECQAGADGHVGQMIAAHRIVDVNAEMVPGTGAVAVERREDVQRYRGRDEQRARGGAEMTRAPNFRAVSLFGGSCSLLLTVAD